MKQRTVFAISALVLLGAAGTVAINNAKNVIETNAAANRTYYLDCNDFAEYDNADSVGFHCWENGVGNDQYVGATKDKDNVWHVEVNLGSANRIQWFRWKDDISVASNRFNYQNDGSDLSKNLYKVSDWDNAGTWTSIAEQNGANEVYTLASTSPSYLTKRIWVDPKDSFFDNSARAALRVFGGGLDTTNYLLEGSSQYTIVNGQYLFYVDIPLSADCEIVRVHSVLNYIWTYGKDFSELSYSTSKVVYAYNNSATYSVDNESTATIEYAKLVLDGYVSCSAGANGYSEIGAINTNIINKLSVDDQTALRSAALTDYSYSDYVDAGYAYGGSVSKSEAFTYGQKIDEMVAQNAKGAAKIDVLNQNESASSSIPVIIASSLSLSIVLLGALYIAYKQKNKVE